jgi:DNA-binding NarL/FixJ family response regulator
MTEGPLKVVLLYDGSLAVRGAFSALDSARKLFSVESVRTIADVEERLSASPQVLVVPVSERVDAALLKAVREWSPSTGVLAVSTASGPGRIASLIAAGVRGYVDLDTECETLFAAVHTVAKGSFFLSGRAVGELFTTTEATAEPGVPSELTERERQVLALIADGWTHKQIGSRLYLSKATVDTYVQRIRQKLGLRNKAELTRAAMRFGIGPG